MQAYRFILLSMAVIFSWQCASCANAQTDPAPVREHVTRYSELHDETVQLIQTAIDAKSPVDLGKLSDLLKSAHQTELAAEDLMSKYKDDPEELRILNLVCLGCQSLSFELNCIVGYFQAGDPWFLSTASNNIAISDAIERRLTIREIREQKKSSPRVLNGKQGRTNQLQNRNSRTHQN